MYYKELANDSYTKTLGATPMRFHNDGLTYMLLEQINLNGDWSYFKETFREFNNMQTSAIPSTAIQKYDTFLDIVNNKSSNTFLPKYLAKYSDQNDFVRNYFSTRVNVLSIQEDKPIVD